MRNFFSTRIVLSAVTLVTALTVLVGATFALFSDTETSANNEFESGVLDLQIDNSSYYNGAVSQETTWDLDDLDGHLFFDFTDVKPGDWGEDTISIHVNNNNAWACVDSTLTSDDENTATTLELEDNDLADDLGDAFDGELGENINFLFWADDGDNVLEEDETDNIFAEGPANEVLGSLSVTLADSIENLFGDPGDPLVGAETYYIAKAWCFGTLTQTPVPAGQGVNPTVNGGISCDGSGLNNITQTDRLTVDVAFSAIQSRNNSSFVCGGTPTPTNTPTPTPTQFACTSVDNIFASSSSDNDQGLRKNGSAILANRSVPSAAFGAPQSAGLPVDAAVPAGSFFSLGFPLNGNTASIVYGFSEPFFNGPGDDLQIYEVTGATTPAYPDEIVKVEVGPTSTGPWTLVAANAIRDELIDINPLTSAQFVRLTDVTPIGPFEPEADAYDLDAIRAFCTAVES